MKDRRAHVLGDVGAVGGRARFARRGGEADLVVEHHVDGASRRVSVEVGEANRLEDHALSAEGGIAMQQQRQHARAVGVVQVELLCA